MNLINHYCRICGVKYQTVADLPGQPEGDVCPMCESLMDEPLTRQFPEACDVRRVQREFERPYVMEIPIGRNTSRGPRK